MGEVFAGFLCGYVIALAFTPLTAYLLLRLRATSVALQRLLPAGTSAFAVGVVLHFAMLLFWTGIGIVFGLVLLAMEGAPEGLGSRNFAFSIFVFALTLAAAAPVIIAVRRLRMQALAASLAVLLLFGWLMPYMAVWSKFE